MRKCKEQIEICSQKDEQGNCTLNDECSFAGVEKVTHKLTPWKRGNRFNHHIFSVEDDYARSIVQVNTFHKDWECTADHIVKCVNMHDELLDCLRDYIFHFDNEYWSDEAVKEWLDDTWIPQVRELLKKAEEK